LAATSQAAQILWTGGNRANTTPKSSRTARGMPIRWVFPFMSGPMPLSGFRRG